MNGDSLTSKIVESVVTAIVTAILTVFGIIAKDAYDKSKREILSAEKHLELLLEFEQLLVRSRDAYVQQNQKVKDLCSKISTRTQRKVAPSYADFLKSHYPSMDQSERIEFALIRELTVRSIQTANNDLNDWLKANRTLVAIIAKKDPALYEQLRELQSHLAVWHAKFSSVFINDPEMCLVYVNDESLHGIGFPKKLEPELAQTIQNWSCVRNLRTSIT